MFCKLLWSKVSAKYYKYNHKCVGYIMHAQAVSLGLPHYCNVDMFIFDNNN